MATDRPFQLRFCHPDSWQRFAASVAVVAQVIFAYTFMATTFATQPRHPLC
jgi:hypothetical protein